MLTGRWSHDSVELLKETLTSAHNIDIKVRLLDLNQKFLQDLSGNFVDGAVSVDAHAETTRALDLSLFDPFHEVSLEPTSPSRTSIFIADMIRVVIVVSTPDRQNVWHIPVFTGPIDSVDRDDFWLDVKCLGKESLSLDNTWRGRTFKKGQEKTDVIRFILENLMGENKINITDRKQRLPNDLKLNDEKSPWSVAKRLAASMNMILYYNGAGVVIMRKKKARRPVIRFTNRWVTTYPKVSYDLSNTINAVRVVGGKPKKAKKKIKYTAVAKRRHSLSPWRLGRGGKPRFLWVEIDDDSIRTKKEAKQIAQRVLNRGLLAGVTVTWDGIPFPLLEELDLCRIDVDGFGAKFAVPKFTIPLVAGDDAAFGYLRRARPKGGPRGVRVRKKNRNKGGRK